MCLSIIQSYNNFITKDTTLYVFLDFILKNIKEEFKNNKIKGGFITYLDETKSNERFKIISSVGKFVNSNNIKIITLKEINKLSIVYLSKKAHFKENIYVNMINKNSQDIFIYLEFESTLTKEEQDHIKIFFHKIDILIENTKWSNRMNNIIKKIQELPALNSTIIDTLNFSTKETKTSEELVEILSSDPLIIATLLKTANSAIFGFRNKVETIDELIYLLGIDFTISIVLGNCIQDIVKIDISSYGIDEINFKELLSKKVKLTSSWLIRENPTILKQLYIPLILHDLGKFIISNHIVEQNKKEDFLNEIKSNALIMDKIERQYCDYSSLDITILVLKHWKLNHSLIETLSNDNGLSSDILNLVNNLFNIITPLDDILIEDSLNQAKELNLNSKTLQKQINIIKEDI